MSMSQPGLVVADADLPLEWCSLCAAETLFAAPACPDGHGTDCPELACTVCGAAVLAGCLAPVRRRPIRRLAARTAAHAA